MVDARPDFFTHDPLWIGSEGFVWMADLVYALEPLFDGAMYRFVGEIFQMQDFIARKAYEAAGKVERLSRDAAPVFLRERYRVFSNRRLYGQDYARRYETRNTSGLVFWEPETATDVHAADTASRTPDPMARQRLEASPAGPDDPPAHKIPRHLQRYALRDSLLEALTSVIDALWKQHRRTGNRPTRSLATNSDHRKLWPEEIQPSRRNLYDLLCIHAIDFDALVEERRTAYSRA